MPKKAVSAQEKQNLEFLAALRAGQVRIGDRDYDTARCLQISKSAFSRKKQAPENFDVRAFRILGRITERLGEDIFPWRNMIMSPECPQHLPVIELMREAAEKLG